MTWTTPTNVSAGTASSSQFNTEVVANLQHLHDELLIGWAAYTPTHSNITVGNATQTARYVRLGDLVVVNFNFALGSTSAIGTGPRVGMPVAASGADAVASVRYTDGTTHYDGQAILASGSNSILLLTAAGAQVSATAPFTWGLNDAIRLSITYEGA